MRELYLSDIMLECGYTTNMLKWVAEDALIESLYFEVQEPDCLILPLEKRPQTLEQLRDELLLKLDNYYNTNWEFSRLTFKYNTPTYRDLEFGKKKRKW